MSSLGQLLKDPERLCLILLIHISIVPALCKPVPRFKISLHNRCQQSCHFQAGLCDRCVQFEKNEKKKKRSYIYLPGELIFPTMRQLLSSCQAQNGKWPAGEEHRGLLGASQGPSQEVEYTFQLMLGCGHLWSGRASRLRHTQHYADQRD